MNKKEVNSSHKDLRKHNLENTLHKAESPAHLPIDDIERLAKELGSYQVELGMQNEQLHESQFQIERSHQELSDLYDVVPIGYFSISSKGLIERANLTATLMLGQEQAHFLQQPFSTFVIREDQDIYYLHRNKILESKQPQECEFRAKRKDGSSFWAYMRCCPVIDESGKIIEIRSVVSDITERKLLEKALRESEERFRLVMNATQDGIWDWNMQTDQVYFSPSWAQIIGLKEAEPEYTTWESRIHPDDKQQTLALLQDLIDGKSEIFRSKHRLMTATGNWKWVIELGRVISRDNEGHPLRIVSTTTDISEQPKAEYIIREDHEQLRSLSAKLSFAEEQERKKIAERIHDNIIQPLVFLDIIVKSLLQATMDTGLKRTYNQMRNMLGTLIKNARTNICDLTTPVLYELGLEEAIREYLHSEVEGKYDLKTVFQCDLSEQGIDQNIMVLIYKAIKELCVNIVKHAEADNVCVSVSQDAENIIVCVEDNGCGFDTDRDLHKQNLSSGYGLFNIQEKIGYLGGHLYIKSTIGVGTQITLSVPFKKQGLV